MCENKLIYKRDNVINIFHMRGFYFRDLITQKKFKKAIELLKPKGQEGDFNMKKAVYKNIKSGKLYTFEATQEPKENGEVETKTNFFNVYDNANTYEAAETKADKKGRAFKVLELEEITLKNGLTAYKTVK